MTTVPSPSIPASTVKIGPPHMSRAERELFQVILASRETYSEFGIGGSTLQAIESGMKRVVSVESDKAWLDAASTEPRLAGAIADGRLSLLHGNVGETKAWGAPADPGSKHLWPGYWRRPWETWTREGKVPQLLFVDGRFRVACTLGGLDFFRRHGISRETYKVIIHDFGTVRLYYNPVLDFFDILENAETLVILQAKEAIDADRLSAALEAHSLDPR